MFGIDPFYSFYLLNRLVIKNITSHAIDGICGIYDHTTVSQDLSDMDNLILTWIVWMEFNKFTAHDFLVFNVLNNNALSI